MAVQVSYPGVYIEEFAPGAPIEGVGTNTAAFIGVAALGDLREPTKITSLQGFLDTFGAHPVPGYYLWYAVRGFFDNGGQTCYVVRVSNGTYDQTKLQDRAGNDIVTVRARQPGALAPSITVDVSDKHLLESGNTSLYQPTASYTVTGTREVQLGGAADAAKFKPGDWVNLGAAGSRLQVTRLVGSDKLQLDSPLSAAINDTGTMRLADARTDDQTVRIQSSTPVPEGALVRGAMLTIQQGTVQDTQVVQSVQTESVNPSDPSQLTYRITFRRGLGVGFSLDPGNPASVQSEEFNIAIGQGANTNDYDNLGADPAHPRYYVRLINDRSKLVKLEAVKTTPPDAPPDIVPAATGGPTALGGGQNENLSGMSAQDYIDALDTLRRVDDVNLVAIPDAVTLKVGTPPTVDVGAIMTVQQAIITHCDQMADRFGVLDPRGDLPLFTTDSTKGVDYQRRSVDSTRGYAALYYPWLCVAPDGPGDGVLVPPSGHVCGIIAFSDTTRGVFKAPANYIVKGAIGIERQMSDQEQGQLNLLGINVIRVFNTGERPQLWGARTTATDRNWQYVNIRRLFLFLEESIQDGIRWAVFEPNNTGLWQKLKLTIRAFLLQQWREGALFGNTPDDAFYVRIDEVLNPFSEQALGRLHIEIGVRPSYPAEFIIVRIGIWQGGSQVGEA